MKHILVVGVHSALGQGLTEVYAKDCDKMAIVSGSCGDGDSVRCDKAVIKGLKEAGVTINTFKGDLSSKKEWDRIISEVTTFLDDSLDLFLYFDGAYFSGPFIDKENLFQARHLMKVNFHVPVLAITAAIPLLKKSKGQLSVMASVSAGRSAPGTSLYAASKRALEVYLKNISNQSGITVTFVYPGVPDSTRAAKLKRKNSHRLDIASFGSIRNSINEKKSEIILAERKAAYGGPAMVIPDPPPFDIDGAGQLSQAAIHHEKINELKEILRCFKRDPDMLVEKDFHDRTPFHYIARGGNLVAFEMVVSKLRKKAVLNNVDSFKWTPLHYAARFGHLRMVRRLIREGADPNALTAHGMSPLHYLARLEPPTDHQNHKFETAYLQTLKLVIEVGADTNQRNCDWFTPVHEAAYNGCPTALAFLLKNEGDAHRKTKSGQQTPLSYAVRSGCRKAVELLLDAGADPHTCFDFAPEDLHSLMETYREKNCRPETDQDDAHKEIIVIRGFEDFPPSATKIIESSGLKKNMELIENNWDVFLYVLRFLTRKIYRTPEEFAENPGAEPKREFKTRTSHGKSLEQASQELITNGNPRKMFKIIEDVGRGGFGSVVMVKRLEDKKQVAIKKVPHLTEKEQWNNLDEIYFLQQCKHACIVKYTSAYLARDEMWMVMEFLEGGSLSQAVSKFHLQENQICYVTKEILRGLVVIHKKNFAHRDLKSANIMLSICGDIKIIDFGLCVELGTTETKNMVGSPFWIPPEMIQRKEHGTPADIWSLAILCLEMANGKPPHRSSALRAMFSVGAGIVPKLRDTDHVTWTDDFRDFLSRMLVIDPAKRETAEQLLQHPWIETADSRNGMAEILHHIFVEKSLEQSLGIV